MGKTTLGHAYKDGETIIKQGTIGDCVYVIQKGKVEVIKEENGHEKKVTELGEKEFFGEMALFEKDVRSCTVRSKGDSNILTLDKKNFYKTIQKDPSIAFRLLERMSARLRETNKHIDV